MKNRISDIIETLRRLPPPSRKDQVLVVPVMEETWMQKLETDSAPKAKACKELTLVADVFNDGTRSWLEWTL